jgi:thioredoxin-related protein
MNKNILIILISIFLVNCKAKNDETKIIKGENYELKIASEQKAILILFPCYPCDIENTKTEAKFLKDIEKEGITTLLLNINQKLFLKESEKIEYAELLNTILKKKTK